MIRKNSSATAKIMQKELGDMRIFKLDASSLKLLLPLHIL